MIEITATFSTDSATTVDEARKVVAQLNEAVRGGVYVSGHGMVHVTNVQFVSAQVDVPALISKLQVALDAANAAYDRLTDTLNAAESAVDSLATLDSADEKPEDEVQPGGVG